MSRKPEESQVAAITLIGTLSSSRDATRDSARGSVENPHKTFPSGQSIYGGMEHSLTQCYLGWIQNVNAVETTAELYNMDKSKNEFVRDLVVETWW